MQAPSFISIAGLARLSARRPWLVVTAWVLAILRGYRRHGSSGRLDHHRDAIPGQPGIRPGTDLLVDSGLRTEDPITETVIIRGETGTVDDPAVREVVEQMTAQLRALTGVTIPESVTNYYEAEPGSAAANALVSEDRRTTLIPVTLAGTLDDATEHIEEYLAVIDGQQAAGIEVLSVGQATVAESQNTIAEEDLAKGEGIGVLAAMVILVTSALWWRPGFRWCSRSSRSSSPSA